MAKEPRNKSRRIGCWSVIALVAFLATLFTANIMAKRITRAALQDEPPLFKTARFGDVPLERLHDPEFVIGIPSGWRSFQAGEPPAVAKVVPERTHSYSAPEENAVLAVAVLPAAVTMDQASASFFFEQMILQEKRLLASHRAGVGAREFQVLEVEFVPRSEGRPMVLIQGSTIVDGTHYKLGLVGWPRDREQLRMLFDRVIETFVIDPGNRVKP